MTITYHKEVEQLQIGSTVLNRQDSKNLIREARASHDKSPDTLLGKVNKAIKES